ncbi:c-type cytochrome [Bradyrhizobium liaoningense]|nr:c-type cytochrome [Bradyrhizobium liaoningense]
MIARPSDQGRIAPGVDARSAGVFSASEARFAIAVLDLPNHLLDAPNIGSQLEQGLRAVRAKGANFAVLPGPPRVDTSQGDRGNHLGETIPGPTTMWAGAVARSLDIWLAVPVFERSDDAETDGNPFLTMLLVNPHGKVEYKGRAAVPNPAFGTVPVARGSYRETVRSVDVGHLRVGVLSGSETMTGVMRLSDLGADVILVSANHLDAEGRDALVALARKANVNIAVANCSSSGDLRAFIATASGDLAGRNEGDGWIVGTISVSARNAANPAGFGLPATAQRPKRVAAMGNAAELGRKLFFDSRLSRDATVACASCHRPSTGFSNNAARGEGIDGHETSRNVTSLLNVAYRPLLRWDGYASSLENFVKYPIIGMREMNTSDLGRLVRLVRDDKDYRDGFAGVFGTQEITFESIELALAEYMRTLVSANSPFDRFYFGGDTGALTPPQRRGLDLFSGKGCAQCHPMGERDTLLTDYESHDLGVGWRAETASYDDIGLGGISTAKQSGRFLTPSLRDVARTAPYMHDGSIATLREVVEFFDRGGNPSPGRDPRIVPLGLTEHEKADLVAFLESLTGDAAWDEQGRAARREGQ